MINVNPPPPQCSTLDLDVFLLHYQIATPQQLGTRKAHVYASDSVPHSVKTIYHY